MAKPTETLSFRVEAELAAAFKEHCARTGEKPSAVLAALLASSLQDASPSPQPTNTPQAQHPDCAKAIADLMDANMHLQEVVSWGISVTKTVHSAPCIVTLPKFPKQVSDYLKTLQADE
jgi:hypothetical protein